ncbi:MAG: hypothetical protein FWD25_11280 [Clostridia bacterium]|nr:hypothetical protein [Clostridia bacterium]
MANHVCVDKPEYARLQELKNVHTSTSEALESILKQFSSILSGSMITRKISPAAKELLSNIDTRFIKTFLSTHEETEAAIANFLMEIEKLDARR